MKRERKMSGKVPTLKDVRFLLAPLCVTIRKSDGEFRVNISGGSEGTAYYTDDISDALGTGLVMGAR